MGLIKSCYTYLEPALKTKEGKIYLTIMITLNLGMLGISIYLNEWFGYFYSALQKYQNHLIYVDLLKFALAAGLFVIMYGYSSYFTSKFQFVVRETLHNILGQHWLGNKDKLNCDVIDQRLQQDLLQLGKYITTFSTGFFNAFLKLPVFAYLLLKSTNWYIALGLILFAALGTYLAKLIAKPLIDLEYAQETIEGKLRLKLVDSTRAAVKYLPELTDVKRNWLQLALKTKNLSLFSSSFSQISVIIPYVALMPLYLSKAVDLGGLMQSANAMGNVLSSISFFVDNRDLIVGIAATLQRLDELNYET